MMTLREIRNEFGVSRRAVQGYEKAGLVSPSGQNKYGYLLYDEIAVERIRSVKMYQDFGFSLKEIQVLVVTSDDVYVDMMSEKVAKMKSQILNLQKNIQIAEGLIANKR